MMAKQPTFGFELADITTLSANTDKRFAPSLYPVNTRFRRI
jgi:hypothetical protein